MKRRPYKVRHKASKEQYGKKIGIQLTYFLKTTLRKCYGYDQLIYQVSKFQNREKLIARHCLPMTKIL